MRTLRADGTAAWEGQPATPEAVDVAAADGIDLAAHRSRRVSAAMLRAADLVLVMEKGQLGTVQGLGADPVHTHVLSDWPEPGEPGLPVSDPPPSILDLSALPVRLSPVGSPSRAGASFVSLQSYLRSYRPIKCACSRVCS